MKKISLWAIAMVLFVVSCSDETNIYEVPQDNLQLETDAVKLKNSIVFDNAGVLDIYENPLVTAKRRSISGKADPVGDYPLTLVAQINPPSYTGGENLAATHVTLDGDFGFVSYNTFGQDYVGAIDVINISDPNNPTVSGRVYFSNADLNAIAYDNGYVYVVGGVDSEKSVTATANSVIAKIACNNGVFNTSDLTLAFQEGFNATDIRILDSKIVVTSGQQGLVAVYNKSDLSLITESPYDDLRSVAVNGTTIAVLDAATGVNMLDENLNLISAIGISSDFGIDAKRTMDFFNDNIVVSEGSNGAGIYNASTGVFVENIPILLSPENAESGDIVTNGVAVNQDVLLMANGAAGLSISEKTANNTDAYGVIELRGSINSVASKDDYIFAASGRSGFQIIKLNRPNQSLVERCSDLQAYNGSRNLNVDATETFSYRGSQRFNDFNIDGSLLLCGSWTVRDGINLGPNALFEMNGTIVVGRNNRRQDVVVASGATLRVEGNLTVYGDLVLEEGATVEFLGSASIASIWGNVVRNGNVNVIGNFTDYYNKF